MRGSVLPGSKKRARQAAMRRRAVELRTEMEVRRQVEQEIAAGPGRRSRPGPVPMVRRLLFRGRRVLAPLVVLAAQPAIGFGGPAGVLVWLVVAAAWWLARGCRRVDRAVERLYAGACVVAAAGWQLWPALGWRPLLLGWVVLSAPWWIHHWPRPRPPDPEPQPLLADPVVEAWDANVAASGRAVAGSSLYAAEPTQHGTQWAMQTVPGQPGHTLGEILGKLPQISHGLRVAQELVMVDKHPDTPDPTVHRLQVIKDSPIVKPVLFVEPRHAGGNVLLGPHADGIGDAILRVYSLDSMWGGFVMGGTGSGKSRLLELIAITVRQMNADGWPTLIAYLDGQGGASSPLLWKHSTWHGGPGDANALLCGLERGLVMRQQWNTHHGLQGFAPGKSPDGGRTPGLPGVLVIIDEQHRIFTPKNAVRWANVARESRKVGFGVLGADQGSDLEQFGGKDVLRTALLAGNGAALRTTSTTAGDLIPGVALDPATFPDLPGYGFKIPGERSLERLAPFRASHLPSSKDEVQYPHVPTREDWFERTSEAELDEMTARAFGAVFTDRHQLAEQAARRAQAAIEGRDLVSLVKASRVAQTARAVAAVPEVVEDEVGGNVDQEILGMLRSGPKSRAELIAESRRGESSVKQGLTRLHRAGQIRRLDKGVYELVAAAVPAA